MLVPVSLFTCPISQQSAKNPVYLKNCLHPFDRDTITRWLQQEFTQADQGTCPICRHTYTLNPESDKDRDIAINKLFEEILLPLVVPSQINQVSEILQSRIPEGREATAEELNKAAQELIGSHITNTALASENKNLSNNVDNLEARINNLLTQHKEEMSARDKLLFDLITLHQQQMSQLAKDCVAEKKQSSSNSKSIIGQVALMGIYIALPYVVPYGSMINKLKLCWR